MPTTTTPTSANARVYTYGGAIDGLDREGRRIYGPKVEVPVAGVEGRVGRVLGRRRCVRDNRRLGSSPHHLALLDDVAFGLVESRLLLPRVLLLLLLMIALLLTAVVVLVLAQIVTRLPGVLLVLERGRVKDRRVRKSFREVRLFFCGVSS